jgi:hypothetical protein
MLKQPTLSASQRVSTYYEMFLLGAALLFLLLSQ